MNTLFKYITIFSLLISLAHAEGERRGEAGSRKLSQEEKKEIFEIKKQDFQKNENIKTKQSFASNYLPPVIYDNDAHNICAIALKGNHVDIEDGSRWIVKPGYRNEALSWDETDPIAIVRNDSFIASYFLGYTYKMINTYTKTYIEVKLHLGPLLDNPLTLQVKNINTISDEIVLSDNSYWQIDSSDSALFNKWLIGDTIIAGTNENPGWFHRSYKNILINVNLLEDVRAKRLD